MAKQGEIRVGTSGWQYDSWKDRLYKGVAKKRWLEHYQSVFPTVEVNGTFYRLPRPNMVERWHDVAPPNFRYAIKGSRFVTHRKEIDGRLESIGRLTDLVKPLKSYLGVVLWQFPEFVERDVEALGRFVKALPGGMGHAIEFRHESWFEGDEALELLEKRGVALVAVSSKELTAVREATAGFVYARFHGLEDGAEHDYTDRELRPWAKWAQDMANEGRDGYFYFNNDGKGMAPKNARRFMEMVGEAAVGQGKDEAA